MNTGLKRAVALAALLAVAVPASAATVRIGVASLPVANGNPFTTASRTSGYTTRAIFDALTQLGPRMSVQPALAQSWRKTDDTTWIVALRPNVAFSNGEPMDADAVVATYTYLKSPEAAVDPLSVDVANVAAVRAVDKLTVEFKTKTPDPAFARQLTIVPIVPPGLWRKVGREGFMSSPVGTGSFQVEKWEKNRVLYVPFKGSWHAPRADRLEIIELPEQSSRLQALLSGGIDIASEIGIEDIDTLKASGFKVYQRPATSVQIIAFNALKAGSPFKDVRVRQAVTYAINREAITKVILHDMVPPPTQTASRNNPDYDPTLKYYPYDPAKAKALLIEAGFPNGFSFVHESIIGTAGNEAAAVLQQIASDLAKVGVKMEIRPLPWPQWSRGVLQTGPTGDTFTFEYETLPTGDTLRPYRLHSCTWPHPWYCDQEIMPLIAEAKTTFDPERRGVLVKQILARTNQQAASLLLYEPLGLDGISPKVQDYNQENGVLPYATMTVRN